MHNSTLFTFFILAISASVTANGRGIEYLSDTVTSSAFDRIIDTRSADLCREKTLAGARCLPPEKVLGPHRRMPNFSGLLWLLGTAGLGGDEHVLVIGDDKNRRDFIAGMLYISGQNRVSILDVPITGSARFQTGPGLLPSKIRERVYIAPMRSESVVLRSELNAVIMSDNPPVLLDGRSDEEYWGARVRAARGGHLPGAQHFSSTLVGSKNYKGISFPRKNGSPIAYGHDGYEGLAYLARLIANDIDSQVYIEGWSGWASDGSLPIDSASYPQHALEADSSPAIAEEGAVDGMSLKPILAAGGGFAMLGFVLGRMSKNRGAG